MKRIAAVILTLVMICTAIPQAGAYYGNTFAKNGSLNVGVMDAITMNLIEYGCKVAGVPTTPEDFVDIPGNAIEEMLETVPQGQQLIYIYRAANGAVEAYQELFDALNLAGKEQKNLLEVSINRADASIQGMLDIANLYIEAGGMAYEDGKAQNSSFFEHYDVVRNSVVQTITDLRKDADHFIFFFHRKYARMIDDQADRLQNFLNNLPSARDLYQLGYDTAKRLDEVTAEEKPAEKPQSSLTISISRGPSGSLPQGKPFYFRGSITSNYAVKKATVSILNTNGGTVQTKTVYPNKKSVDILADGLDDLKFGKLAPGAYTLTLSASDAAGSSKQWSSSFTIAGSAAASSLAIQVKSGPSGTLPQGKPFYFSGTITSNYKVTSATVSILNSSGAVEQTKTVYPNKTTVDFLAGGLDDLKFGKLACGSYTMTLSATDSSGSTQKWSSRFSIGAPSNTLRIQLTSAPSGTVAYGKPFYCRGSITSNYAISSATVSIKNASGTTVQTKTVYPNQKSVDILAGGLDDLKFGKLAKGSYTFHLTAQDENGGRDSYSSSFTVR